MIHFFESFYAVPRELVVFLMGLGLLVWVILGSLCMRGNPIWEKIWLWVNRCLCMVAGIAILKMTLLGRSSGVRQLELRPFYMLTTVSYNNEAYRTLLMNVFLFFPLGLTLPWILPVSKRVSHRIRTSILIAMGCSIVIEVIQFYFCLGRAETDDVICNTLGGMLGTMAYLAVLIH